MSRAFGHVEITGGRNAQRGMQKRLADLTVRGGARIYRNLCIENGSLYVEEGTLHTDQIRSANRHLGVTIEGVTFKDGKIIGMEMKLKQPTQEEQQCPYQPRGAQRQHASSINCEPRGTASHTEGNTTLTGNLAAAAHAEGLGTQAMAAYSHVEGFRSSSQLLAEASHAMGVNATTLNVGQFAIGGGRFERGSGDIQTNVFTLGYLSDASKEPTTFDLQSGFGTNGEIITEEDTMTLPVSSSWFGQYQIIGRDTTTGDLFTQLRVFSASSCNGGVTVKGQGTLGGMAYGTMKDEEVRIGSVGHSIRIRVTSRCENETRWACTVLVTQVFGHSPICE